LDQDWLVGQHPEAMSHYPPQIIVGMQQGEEIEFYVNDEHPQVKIVIQELKNEYNFGNPTGLFNLSLPHLDLKTGSFQSFSYVQYKKLQAHIERQNKMQQQKEQEQSQETPGGDNQTKENN